MSSTFSRHSPEHAGFIGDEKEVVNDEDFDEKLPQYPSLARAIIIEARHQSRLDVVRLIRRTNLFEDMTEARSLADGLRLIQNHAADACFLGPSISPERALEFIFKATQVTFSTDCAFIALLRQIDSQLVDRFQESGAHGVIDWPCNKKVLSDSIIRGVIRANADSPWRGILLSELGDESMLMSELATLLPGADPAPATKPEIPESLRRLFERTAATLNELSEGATMGMFGLTPAGTLTLKTREEINKLLDSLAKEQNETVLQEGFRTFFETALCEWFVDVINETDEIANNRLKKKLLAHSMNQP